MTVARERKIIRWFHILASIPVMGYMYGPVSEISEASFVTRFILFPLIILSGIWMWKRHVFIQWRNKSRLSNKPESPEVKESESPRFQKEKLVAASLYESLTIN